MVIFTERVKKNDLVRIIHDATGEDEAKLRRMTKRALLTTYCERMPGAPAIEGRVSYGHELGYIAYLYPMRVKVSR